MNHLDFDLDGKKAEGLVVGLPGAPLVLAYGRQGFVMCGYLNIEAADKLGVAAAMVRGVSTIDDLLDAKVQKVSGAAGKLGVAEGMTGREALSRFL